MKTLLRTTTFAVSFAAAALTSQAQVLTDTSLSTFDPANAYSNGFDLGNDIAATQTFTGAGSANFVTFRFIALSGSSFGASNLEFAFTDWSGGNFAVGSGGIAPAAFFNLAIDSSASWENAGSHIYFDYEFNLSPMAGALDTGTTYGLSLVGDATSSAYRIAGADTPTASPGFTKVGVTSFSDLTGSGGVSTPFATGLGEFAFDATEFSGQGFSGLSAVPETGSAAVLFAGIFVGGLMLRRQRFLRHTAPAPVEA
ncbi:MAG: hypothetical protein SynsKO_33050 [Synoicihabitans sp.]